MKKRSAFTLMELIIVLVILGILALLVVPRLADVTGKAKDTAALHNAQAVSDAAEMAYFTEKRSGAQTYHNGELDAYLKNVKAGDVSYEVSLDQGRVTGGYVKSDKRQVTLPVQEKAPGFDAEK